jgi:hypothetical protein
MKSEHAIPPIPELGQILKFLMDCFDIRRDGNPLTHKQVQRLAKGKGQSRETIEQVARSIVDTIYEELSAGKTTAGRTAELMAEWARRPHMAPFLAVNDKGTVVLPPDQILKDLIEFCWRHQELLTQLPDCKGTNAAIQFWLSGFVIPYVVSTVVDYYFTGNNPDSGMPGGRIWYLPMIYGEQKIADAPCFLMPSQQVLLWWEDLLGRDLESFAKNLCGPTSDPESARRQIGAWKKEALPPDSETIRRWTKQEWDYQGVFHDDPTRPLKERWNKCRDFLEAKGMNRDSDWIKGAEDSLFEPERVLATTFRGERLEQEICPFKDYPFKRFFESSDPEAENLPVEKLIERVAERWRTPTRIELHSRLMLGRAMNLAWNACAKKLGIENTLNLIRWASCAYNHYMTLCSRSERISAPENMRLHCQLVERADPGFHPLAAMLDQQHWETLPAYLRMWIRGEVRFKD